MFYGKEMVVSVPTYFKLRKLCMFKLYHMMFQSTCAQAMKWLNLVNKSNTSHTYFTVLVIFKYIIPDVNYSHHNIQQSVRHSYFKEVENIEDACRKTCQ